MDAQVREVTKAILGFALLTGDRVCVEQFRRGDSTPYIRTGRATVVRDTKISPSGHGVVGVRFDSSEGWGDNVYYVYVDRVRLLHE